jgi:hypothetical protein
MAITLKISTKRLNIVDLVLTPLSYGPKSGIFKPRGAGVGARPKALSNT